MIWDRLSRERSGVIYCFSCLYGPMVSCRVPCAANNYLVKSVPSGLPSIPHRFRPASHSVPYRYRRSIIGHTVYSSPALVVHRGPVQQLFVPARSRRKRRRPARMGSDQTRLEHRKRFQAMRPALCGRRVHVSAPLPPSYEGGRWGARMCPPPAHATRWETWRFALCGRHARVSAPPPPRFHHVLANVRRQALHAPCERHAHLSALPTPYALLDCQCASVAACQID